MQLTDLQRELANEGLANLERLKNDYSNDIPTESVHSTSPNPYYKIRKAWFTSVGMNLSALEIAGLLPAKGTVLVAVAGFRKDVQNVLGDSKIHPERKHIDQTDAVIDTVISHLRAIIAKDSSAASTTKPRKKKKDT